MKRNRWLKRTGFAMTMLVLVSSCYHGRVRLAPPVPKACRNGLENTVACRISSREQAVLLEKSERAETVVNSNFYLFGFVPSEQRIDAGSYCPNGVYEVHQYFTWMDALLANITAGFYIPRTTKIVCY